MKEPLIAFVGKPSSGKSTTLNALCNDEVAKMGAFPFTTIDPNRGVGFLAVDCACARYDKQAQCRPLYGTCKDGRRKIPVALLDVAGLIPGAHEGKGLGNRFLNDLTVADCLVHVVDASGTTDENGKECRGYDPYKDVAWLQTEIVQWIYGNLKGKWGSVVRRHIATKSSVIDTVTAQLNGYGARSGMIQTVFDKLNLNSEGARIEHWTQEQLIAMVKVFVTVRFPTVISLNKIDHPDSDLNIAKIANNNDPNSLVLTSSLTELFLRKLVKQNLVQYEEGTEFLDTIEDLPDSNLRPLDDKTRDRIENVRDMVLYRHGSTGVAEILRKACLVMLQLTPVYIVRNATTFAHNDKQDGAFREVHLVRIGTKIGGKLYLILLTQTSHDQFMEAKSSSSRQQAGYALVLTTC